MEVKSLKPDIEIVMNDGNHDKHEITMDNMTTSLEVLPIASNKKDNIRRAQRKSYQLNIFCP